MQIVVPDDLGSDTLSAWIAATARLDAAGYDMILLDARREDNSLDALSIAAFCATGTSRIGLCVTVDTTTVEPFTFARGLATLDHLSGGRASWRCVGDSDAARAAEFASVVAKLLQSWDKDALVERHADGILSDADKVRPILHKGAFFFSRGPLNIPQPPQGVPPLIALYTDAVSPHADLTLEEDMLLHCSITDIDHILSRSQPGVHAPLRDRLGLS